ncbi:MAG TPA: hypothetical protein VJT73_15875 [Polyangiaceae bacterium]|nr:hypothetical protein [Polyangiaceae bacterium]
MGLVRASLGLAAVLVVSTGCAESSKVSERKAMAHVERLAKVVDDDVEEVRRGLPRGAKALGQIWEGNADPRADLGSVRRALDKVRNDDRDLGLAKSTFFALADDKTTVLRSDQEPEQLAGKALNTAYPALIKVLAGEIIETRGSMPETAGARTGGDEQWVASAPVRDGQGVVRGMYITGWSMRRFAYHLEETLKHDLTAEALRASDSRVKQPLVYVFVFSGAKVYGAPVTPLVNAQALEGLDLAAKTDNGAVFHQQLEITGRGYGLAASRTSKLGDATGVAVLRSEI